MHLLCGAMPVGFTLKKNSTPSTDEQQNLYYLITPCQPRQNLKKLDILPLQEQFVYNTAVLMFKIHMGWAPQYVCDLLNRAPARYESKTSHRALALTYIRWVLLSLGHLSGTLFLWQKKTYKFVNGFKVDLRKIVFRRPFDITMFVKLFCLYLYCSCLHYW